MQLSYNSRSVEKKCEAKRLRRSGYIPAVIYSGGKFLGNIAIKDSEFRTSLKQIESGFLPVTTFDLSGEGKKSKAIVKGIQYNPVTYDIEHLDFEELKEDVLQKVDYKAQDLQHTDQFGCQ